MPENGPVFELRLALTVEDLDTALAFWRDALGLPLSHSWGEGDCRGAVAVADPAGLAARLAAAGAAQQGAVVETPWGHRNVRLSTPEGLSLTLFTEMKRPG